MYEIISVIKPGARLSDVMHRIEFLADNYTLNDHIIIIAGSNDICAGKTPSFRFICNKLKQCSHTNVLFTSVPYFSNKHFQQRHIYKYNVKLSDFLCKFNNYIQGYAGFVEINNKSAHNLKTYIAQSISDIINNSKPVKNLKFINLDSCIAYETNTEQSSDSSGPEIDDNIGNFLYPNLSQLELDP